MLYLVIYPIEEVFQKSTKRGRFSAPTPVLKDRNRNFIPVLKHRNHNFIALYLFLKHRNRNSVPVLKDRSVIL